MFATEALHISDNMLYAIDRLLYISDIEYFIDNGKMSYIKSVVIRFII